MQNGLIYLADVVHSDRNADERTNGDKELADGEHNPVEPMLERRSDKSETDWHQDEVCGPEGVKAELRLPDAMVTTSEPERDSVAEELPIQEPNNNANPVNQSDYTAMMVSWRRGLESVTTATYK